MWTVLWMTARNPRTRRWVAVLACLLVLLFLTVPGAILAATAPPPPAPVCGATPAGRVVAIRSAAGLDAGQLRNAGLIIGIGRSLALPPRAWTVALMAALQESTLRNLDHGDVVNGVPTTSKGLFQMLAGTAAAAGISNTDPVADIRWFYRTLANVPNWQALTPDAAAQSVELSGNPDAYGKWQPLAEQLIRDSTPGQVAAAQASTPLPCRDATLNTATGRARVAVKAALAQAGRPYCWGGGGTAGPSPGDGTSPGCSTAHPGFDCSGLMQFAWGRAGVALDRTTALMVSDGPQIQFSRLTPGDLIFPDPGHVVMWLGGGKIVEAPHDGLQVRVTRFYGMWKAIHVGG